MKEPSLTCKYPLPITMGSLSLIISQENDYIQVSVAEEENGKQEICIEKEAEFEAEPHKLPQQFA